MDIKYQINGKWHISVPHTKRNPRVINNYRGISMTKSAIQKNFEQSD